MGNEVRTEGDVRNTVREHYARTAREAATGPSAKSARAEGCGCGCGSGAIKSDELPMAKAATSSCCGGSTVSQSERLGYSAKDLASVPAEADMGLGCGNPTAIGTLRPGETVLDLGSGGGIDCFIASRKVGPQGRVIGVDMTPEMIDRARTAAAKGSYRNVEFRLGEIESLPVADGTVDAVISNCVINLSPDKPRVFREAFRALRPGGRLMVSDIVLRERLPERLLKNAELWAGCVAGAMMLDDYLAAIRDAGFSEVAVTSERRAGELFGAEEADELLARAPGLTPEELRHMGDVVASVAVLAKK